jgi:hypothetical protein
MCYEKWEFDDLSFEYASKFVFKFNRTVAERHDCKTWQDLRDMMKSLTQSEFWRFQREKKKDLTTWGTMGFDITILRRDYEPNTLWCKASLSASIVHNLLTF